MEIVQNTERTTRRTWVCSFRSLICYPFEEHPLRIDILCKILQQLSGKFTFSRGPVVFLILSRAIIIFLFLHYHSTFLENISLPACFVFNIPQFDPDYHRSRRFLFRLTATSLSGSRSCDLTKHSPMWFEPSPGLSGPPRSDEMPSR
jgi:hypothetical protein